VPRLGGDATPELSPPACGTSGSTVPAMKRDRRRFAPGHGHGDGASELRHTWPMSAVALGEFLRARREQLRPEDVGLAWSGRRRCPGCVVRSSRSRTSRQCAPSPLRSTRVSDPAITCAAACGAPGWLSLGPVSRLLWRKDGGSRPALGRRRLHRAVRDVVASRLACPGSADRSTRCVPICRCRSWGRASGPVHAPGGQRWRPGGPRPGLSGCDGVVVWCASRSEWSRQSLASWLRVRRWLRSRRRSPMYSNARSMSPVTSAG
jgi:hypothetical protein